MTELDVDQAAANLPALAGAAHPLGAITFIVDVDGRRLGAVVPAGVAEQALRLRAEAKAIEIRECKALPSTVSGNFDLASRRDKLRFFGLVVMQDPTPAC